MRGVSAWRIGLRRGLEAVLGAGRHGDGIGAKRADRAGIGRVERVADQGGVALVQNGVVGGQKGGLSAGRDKDVAGGCRHARALGDARGDRFAQGGDAGDGGIAHGAVQRGLVHLVQDLRVGSDVMFADCQLDHGNAGILHFARAIEHGPTVGFAAQQAGVAL